MENTESFDFQKEQLKESMQAIVDAILDSFKKGFELLSQIKLPGYVLVLNRFNRELKSWGMPEKLALWLTWNLPYRYINLCVRVMKR